MRQISFQSANNNSSKSHVDTTLSPCGVVDCLNALRRDDIVERQKGLGRVLSLRYWLNIFSKLITALELINGYPYHPETNANLKNYLYHSF